MSSLLPLVAPGPELTSEQVSRYSRHLLVPGMGIEAQRRLLAARVAVDDKVRGYVRDLMRATRSTPMISLGAGPRAGVHLLVASRWAARRAPAITASIATSP